MVTTMSLPFSREILFKILLRLHHHKVFIINYPSLIYAEFTVVALISTSSIYAESNIYIFTISVSLIYAVYCVCRVQNLNGSIYAELNICYLCLSIFAKLNFCSLQ